MVAMTLSLGLAQKMTAVPDGERNRVRRCRRASLPLVVAAISATPYGDGLQPLNGAVVSAWSLTER